MGEGSAWTHATADHLGRDGSWVLRTVDSTVESGEGLQSASVSTYRTHLTSAVVYLTPEAQVFVHVHVSFLSFYFKDYINRTCFVEF